MKNALLQKLKESSFSILPIMAIVLILGLTIVPLSWQLLVQFLVACVMLIIGISLFTHGADMAMLPIGQYIGGYVSKSAKIWLMLLIGFVVGIIITVAEPDLNVLASQITSINKWLLIGIVGVGVGFYMLIGVLRTVFNAPLNIILLVTYGLIFVICFFVPNEFLPLAFDSGSVTTGPISVPFLMAFGLGLTAVRASKSNSSEQSFGLIALGSAGPILAVMIMGLFIDPSSLVSANEAVSQVPQDFGGIMLGFAQSFPKYIIQVLLVLTPIILFFLIFQCFALKLPKREVSRIFIGLIFVFVGITVFFVGVSTGFLPVGAQIGQNLASASYNWVLIPICIVVGLFIVLAEPAVHVLSKQVEQLTEGAISRKTIFFSLCIGVGLSLGLCAIRVLFQFSLLYILVPMYLIALILAFIVPPIFTGIAFDSGGVSTGAMATTFVLPLFMGACEALGISSFLFGFGTLAVIAVTPLLTVQVLGLIVKIADIRQRREDAEELVGNKRIEIIEFD